MKLMQGESGKSLNCISREITGASLHERGRCFRLGTDAASSTATFHQVHVHDGLAPHLCVQFIVYEYGIIRVVFGNAKRLVLNILNMFAFVVTDAGCTWMDRLVVPWKMY